MKLEDVSNWADQKRIMVENGFEYKPLQITNLRGIKEDSFCRRVLDKKDLRNFKNHAGCRVAERNVFLYFERETVNFPEVPKSSEGYSRRADPIRHYRKYSPRPIKFPDQCYYPVNPDPRVDQDDFTVRDVLAGLRYCPSNGLFMLEERNNKGYSFKGVILVDHMSASAQSEAGSFITFFKYKNTDAARKIILECQNDFDNLDEEEVPDYHDDSDDYRDHVGTRLFIIEDVYLSRVDVEDVLRYFGAAQRR